MLRHIAPLAFMVACGSDSPSTNDAGADAIAQDVVSPDVDAGPITPTASSWLGTNVAADLSRVDVTYQLQPFDGSGKSSTDIGFVLPTGTYEIAFKGTGTLAVSGIGKLGPTWTQANGEQRNTLQITGTPGAFGNFLTLQITNQVTGVRILYPGFDYDTAPLFLPSFLALLKPFRALRFMDWESTNNSTITDWANRPSASQFGASPNGEPWEHIVELVNETGKDCWVTVPEHATDAYIHAMAQFLRTNLDFARIASARASQGMTAPFEVIVEDSNETWNQGFSAYATFLAAAKTNASKYTGKYTGTFGPSWMTSDTALMQVAQYHGDRLAKIGDVFKQEFTDHANAIKPVLSGWALGAGYSDASLAFIQANYGAPKDHVAYVAIAPYFANADDTTTGSLAALFPALAKSITDMNAAMQDFTKLGAQYGIAIAAYEGGQSITGNTNLQIKHLAQFDSRMRDTYLQYIAFWKQNFGNSLFMHFSLAGDLGLPENIYQYGFWGSIASVRRFGLRVFGPDERGQALAALCPKYEALAEQVP